MHVHMHTLSLSFSFSLSLSLSLPNTYTDLCIGYINIHGTHVTANNSTTYNVLFLYISDLKIVCYNNY